MLRSLSLVVIAVALPVIFQTSTISDLVGDAFNAPAFQVGYGQPAHRLRRGMGAADRGVELEGSGHAAPCSGERMAGEGRPYSPCQSIA